MKEIDYEALGVDPPRHFDHDVTQLEKLRPTNWRLSGNELKADTDWGTLVQRIDPGYILTGTDAEGLPILKKIA